MRTSTPASSRQWESKAQPHSRLSWPAALSAAVLLFAVAQVPAQGLVGVGHGSVLTANQQDVLRFSFIVTEGGNGSVHGLSVWRGPNSITIFRVSSSTILPDGTLAFAGPIIAVIGTPPSPANAVGSTAFSAFRDNGFGAVDETTSLSVIPPMFGNPTIQQILLPPPMGAGPPPPAAYRPLLSGSVWIP